MVGIREIETSVFVLKNVTGTSVTRVEVVVKVEVTVLIRVTGYPKEFVVVTVVGTT